MITNMKNAQENRFKILWDIRIQTETTLEHDKPDIVLLDKQKKKQCLVEDSTDHLTWELKAKKRKSSITVIYNNYDILKVCERFAKNVITVPVIIGALGSLYKKKLNNYSDIELWFGNGVIKIKHACLVQQSYTENSWRQIFDKMK